jgi:hypothetical protein
VVPSHPTDRPDIKQQNSYLKQKKIKIITDSDRQIALHFETEDTNAVREASCIPEQIYELSLKAWHVKWSVTGINIYLPENLIVAQLIMNSPGSYKHKALLPHQSMPLVLNLSQMNPVHIFSPDLS